MSKWHLRWKISGLDCADPAREQLLALKRGDMAIILVAASKADPFSVSFGNHPVYLPFVPDDPLNAAKWLASMELQTPIRGEQARRAAPLFAIDVQGKEPFYNNLVENTLSNALKATSLSQEECVKLTPHSFRVGLACALLAANTPFPVIKALCRWRDDDSVKIYARMSPTAYCGHLARARQGYNENASRQAANFPCNFLDEGAALRMTFERDCIY